MSIAKVIPMSAPSAPMNASIASSIGQVPVVAHINVGRPLKSVAADGAAYAAGAGLVLIAGGVAWKFVVAPVGAKAIDFVAGLFTEKKPA